MDGPDTFHAKPDADSDSEPLPRLSCIGWGHSVRLDADTAKQNTSAAAKRMRIVPDTGL